MCSLKWRPSYQRRMGNLLARVHTDTQTHTKMCICSLKFYCVTIPFNDDFSAYVVSVSNEQPLPLFLSLSFHVKVIPQPCPGKCECHSAKQALQVSLLPMLMAAPSIIYK